MSPLTKKLYNVWTYFWYKILHAPLRSKVIYDNRARDAKLTVVFLHGIAATSSTWRSLVNTARKDKNLADIRFISLDLLGFGKSPRADWLKYNYLDYERAIDHALKHAKVKTPVVIVGHSMGSLIAADYATHYRPSVAIQKLILVSPPVLLTEELAHIPDKVYTRTYASLHQAAKDYPAVDTIAGLIQKFSSFRREYLSTAAFRKSMDNIILCRGNYQTFTHLRVPTLIIHGHFDPLVIGKNLRRVAARNPKYVKYQSVIGQHDISPSKRARIITEIKKVLKEVS